MRKLQRYTVNIPRNILDQLKRDGGVQEVYSEIYVQGCTLPYHEDLGLCPDRSAIYRSSDLIC